MLAKIIDWSARNRVLVLLITVAIILAILSAIGRAPARACVPIAGALTTANGYTAGGAALASKTTLRAAGVMTFDAADVVWTASGGSITARYLVLYASVARDGFTNPLIGYALLDTTPADVTATDTNTLTIQWSASGIFTAIV